jgi:hypothetical protein
LTKDLERLTLDCIFEDLILVIFFNILKLRKFILL